MDTSRKHILQYLDSRHIPYDMVVHDPVYTMEEGAALNLPHKQQIAKNLFLCDDKKEHYPRGKIIREAKQKASKIKA